MPSLVEGNALEELYPWGVYNTRRVNLGARLQEAFTGMNHATSTLQLYEHSKFAVGWW